MMITIQGELWITTSKTAGRTTKQAALNCELGRFQVCYEQALTMAEGCHTGMFAVSAFKPSMSQDSEGQCIVTVLAVVDQHWLAYEKPTKKDTAPNPSHKAKVEPTDVSESKQADCFTQPVTDSSLKEIVDSVYTDSADDEQLFAELWPLGHSVKLDASQGREKLREQHERLIELGYAFNSDTQTWVKLADEDDNT